MEVPKVQNWAVEPQAGEKKPFSTRVPLDLRAEHEIRKIEHSFHIHTIYLY
jgi:hypothetical protein